MKLIKPTIVALVASFAALTGNHASAQDATAAMVTAAGGAVGYLGGKALDMPLAGAALVPAIANWGYNAFKKKGDEDKVKYYISGQNYQRWVQSQETWYQSTLDPHTGRPQAFSGLNEMEAGMPVTTSASQTKPDISKVYTVPVKLPAGTYKGVPLTERMGTFPKLP